MSKFRIDLEHYFSTNSQDELNSSTHPYLEDDLSSVEDLFNRSEVDDFDDTEGILNFDFDATNKQSPSQFTSELSPLFLTIPSNNGNNGNNRNRELTINTLKKHNLYGGSVDLEEEKQDFGNSIIRKKHFSPPTPFSYFTKSLKSIFVKFIHLSIRYQIYWTLSLLISSFIPSILSIDILQRLLRILVPFSGYSLLGLPGDSEDIPFPNWLFSSSVLTSDLLICLIVITFMTLIMTNFVNFYYKSLNFIKILLVLLISCAIVLVFSMSVHYTNDHHVQISTIYSKDKPQRVYLEQSSDYLFNYNGELSDGLIIQDYTRYYPTIEMMSSDKSSLVPPMDYLKENLNSTLQLRYFSGNSKVTFDLPLEYLQESMFSHITILNYTRSPYYNYSRHEITLSINLKQSVHVQGLFIDLANGPYIETFDLNSKDSNYKSNNFYEDYGWSNYSRIFKYDIESDSTILDIVAYSSNSADFQNFQHLNSSKNGITKNSNNGYFKSFVNQHESSPPSTTRLESNSIQQDMSNTLVVYARTYQCDWNSVQFGKYFFELNEFTTSIGKAFCSFVQDTALIQLKLH